MNNQNLYKNSDFTKKSLLYMGFSFLFMERVSGRIHGEELITADETKTMFKTTFADFLKYGFGALALFWFFAIQKYFISQCDYTLFLDLYVSGIIGAVWVFVRPIITDEFEPKATNFASALFYAALIGLAFLMYYGFKVSILKIVMTSFGAGFTTVLTFELALALIRKDYQNYRRISVNEFIYIRPTVAMPYKKSFLAFSILVFIAGAAGMTAAEIKKEREDAMAAAKHAAIEKKDQIKRLQKQAEDNGSAYILYTYSKIQPANEKEAKVNALLKIDLGMDKKTDVIYPWDKNYPGYGGKYSQVIR